jgi:hypothetical protein
MRHWIKAVGALAMMVSGCSAIVLDPLDDDSSGLKTQIKPGAGTAPATPGAVAMPPSAVAMRFSEWQIPSNDSSLFNVSLVGTTPDPDALVLFFASRSQACAQPAIHFNPGTDPAACAGEAFWQTILVIPPDLAHPGVVDLDDRSIFVHQVIWMSSCGGGSGNIPGIPGTLEIVSIDETSVSVKLNLDQLRGWGTQNGDYTASLCP